MSRFPIAVAVALLVALSVATTATARPCRTFIISSYSFRNPNSNTFATITEIRSFTPLYYIADSINNDNNYKADDNNKASNYDLFFLPRAERERVNPRAPLGYDFSSLRDRTKDILSVALALLFGVGCGALTAATMYLVWSVFATRHRAANYDDLFSSDDEDEIESAKKFGYVKIPAAEAAAPAPPAPSKGSV